MQSLASFIMSGRSRAVLVAAAGALLSLLLPPFSYVSGAVVALVTLRHGPWEGLLVAAAAVAATAALALAALQTVLPAVGFAMALWLPLWLLGMVLRRTVSLAFTAESAALLGGLGVAAVHLLVAEPAAWWEGLLSRTFGEALQGNGEGLREILPVMGGIVASATLLSLMLALLLARWWQAQLYNPGGFRREFHGLRLHRGVAVAALATFVGASLGEAAAGTLATELALVVVMLYLFQGLAVVHGTVALRGIGWGWLAVVYGLLLLSPPKMLVGLSALGFADSWIDFRARLAGKGDGT